MSAPAGKPPVVLLAYHYPPSPEVGAVRAARVAAALAGAGHPVTVIRAGTRPDEPAPGAPGIEVRTVVPAPSPRDWYGALRRAVRENRRNAGTGSPAGIADSAAASWRPPADVSAGKRLALSLFWLPDDRQGFIWRAARAAAAALQDAGPRAVLYSTSPPHSAQLAGLLAQLWTRAPWVAEFRDPWTDNPDKAWYCRTEFTDRLERWAERQCLRRAALVVGVSEGICGLLRPRAAAAGGGNVMLVRNGIETATFGGSGARADGQRPPGPLRILHAGTCYLGRDPRPFLEALAAVSRRRGLGPDRVQVELLGRCEWFEGVSMRQVAASLGIQELVRFTPWLPPDQARQRMEEADLLLLLAEGQPLQVPQKLYEYLGTGRRMLVFADPGGETARMVETVGGHVVTHAAAPDLEAQVEQALLSPAKSAPDRAVLADWATDRQMSRLVEAVAALGSRRA